MELQTCRKTVICNYTDTKMIIMSSFDSQFFRKAFCFLFPRGSTLRLISIQNKKGSQKTTITSVSGGQGSWMCKKATVQVSVNRQVSQ